MFVSLSTCSKLSLNAFATAVDVFKFGIGSFEKEDLKRMEHGCTKVGRNGRPAAGPPSGKSKKLQSE